MTSIVNNSNSNSALVNTLLASDSKMNPNVYSTKKIYPPASTTYQRTDSSSGTVGASQTITFDLLKYGIAQQLLFCYEKGTGGSPAFDFLDVIDRIELLSSSKVVDTLTNYDLQASFSNLESSQYLSVSDSCVKVRAAAPSNLYVVPLVFGFFKDINTNLNLQFNEPMSVRVKFGANVTNDAAGGTTSTLDSAYLRLRYKAYNEGDYSEIITQNYSEPELNQMICGYYDENVETTASINAGANNGVNGSPVELKNTDCVNDFYIIVRKNGAGPAPPVPIDRVRLTASGQEIFDLSAEELLYSKLCENGYVIAGATDDTKNVVKIQTGLWEYSGGGTQSNTMSLRELNNPKLDVFFTNNTGGASAFDVICVEDAVKIVSTVSSNGRIQTSLTN